MCTLQIIIVVNVSGLILLGLFARTLLARDVAETLTVDGRGKKRQHNREAPRKPRRSPCRPKYRFPRSHGFSTTLPVMLIETGA